MGEAKRISVVQLCRLGREDKLNLRDVFLVSGKNHGLCIPNDAPLKEIVYELGDGITTAAETIVVPSLRGKFNRFRYDFANYPVSLEPIEKDSKEYRNIVEEIGGLVD